MTTKVSLPPFKVLALSIFLISLIVRIAGIGWGLPNQSRLTSLHPDEPVNLIVLRSVNPLAGDFEPSFLGDPGFYNYGTLFFTLNRLFQPGDIGGTTFDSAQDAQVILMARLLSAIFGAVAAALLFVFLTKFVRWPFALGGGLMMGLVPGVLMHSRFFSPDVMAMTFCLGALILASKAVHDPSWKHVLPTALFAGLAGGVKYNMVLVILALVPMLWTHEDRKDAALKFAGACAATVVTFLIAVPGVLINPQAFMADLQYELWHTGSGHGMVFAGTAPGPIFHLVNLMQVMGAVFALVGLAGLVWVARKKDPALIGWLIFAGVYFVLIARAEVKFARYVFPLVPVLILGAVVAMDQWEQRPQKVSKISFGLTLFLLLSTTLSQALTFTLMSIRPDNRDMLPKFLTSAKSVGFVSDPWFYSISLYPGVNLPRWIPFETREQLRKQSKVPALRYVPENPDERLDWDPRLITELKPEYIIFSAFEQEGYENRANSTDQDAPLVRYREFKKLLRAQYTQTGQQFAGFPGTHDLCYVSPPMEVWLRNPDSKTP